MNNKWFCVFEITARSGLASALTAWHLSRGASALQAIGVVTAIAGLIEVAKK